MEVYVARQPIFDRLMNVYAYELLYRRSSSNNYFEGIDDQQATAEVINNGFLANELHHLTDHTKAFINFSEELLVKEIPLLLPKESVVIEILERVKPTEQVIEACRNLKKHGYLIALDDFVFDPGNEPLIKLANIIKVEYPVVPHQKQKEMIRKYKQLYGTIFLAEKIETREQQKLAYDLGYDLFQGYFYSKPVIVKGREISNLEVNMLQIMDELGEDEPDYKVLSNIIERDLSLSYKLLRIVNSVGYGSKYKINSINSALTRLGINEMKKWMYLMLLQENKTVENKELIKISLIRAKLMELLSEEIGTKNERYEFFLAGMFSSIHILLHKKMDDIINELPLTADIEDALLGERNEIKQVLDLTINIEEGNWLAVEEAEIAGNIPQQTLMSLYITSLQWVMNLQQ